MCVDLYILVLCIYLYKNADVFISIMHISYYLYAYMCVCVWFGMILSVSFKKTYK